MIPPTNRILQFLVVFLTTDLGDHYSVLTAFSSSSSLGIHRFISLSSTYSKTLNKNFIDSVSTTQLSLSSDEDDHQLLLDESILLYYQVSRQKDFDIEIENDINTLRKYELTTLIEDVVFDAVGKGEKNNEGETRVELEEERGPENLTDISQALDNLILLGHHSTHTEEELDQWVNKIDFLYEKLQTQLYALPSTSPLIESTTTTNVTTNTIVNSTTTTLVQLHVRLESMRTLIDPEGKGRLRLPLAQPKIEITNTEIN